MKTHYIIMKTIRDNRDGFARPTQRDTRYTVEITKDEARKMCAKQGKTLRNVGDKFGISWSTIDARGLKIDFYLEKCEDRYFNPNHVQYATEAVKRQRETR